MKCRKCARTAVGGTRRQAMIGWQGRTLLILGILLTVAWIVVILSQAGTS